jgi:type IV secretion system protein VirD4
MAKRTFPRGTAEKGRRGDMPMGRWAPAEELSEKWNWQPGRVLLGRAGERRIGIEDDRHVMVIAGTGGGKTSKLLKHNVARWPGSLIVNDPKGELVEATLVERRAQGHECIVLDAFEITDEPSASYNPFSELGFGRARNLPADAALAADALIIANKGDPHWTDAARNLLRGTILDGIRGGGFDLAMLRETLNATPARLEELFDRMADSTEYDGILANIGRAFIGKAEGSPKELAGILSTAQEQTAPLDDVAWISRRSDFRMSDLASGRLTIYLVLPGMRVATHFRWLRLVVQMALAAMERHPVPRGRTPVLFLLEEFASLGNMRSIESAAGLMRGMGVKLFIAAQDLNQIKHLYPESWETFLGNVGQLLAFSVIDLTTTEYLSRLLGTTQVIEVQDTRLSGSAMSNGDDGRREHIRQTRLLEPEEIRMFFAREEGRSMLIVPGRPPIYLDLMEHFQ